MKGSEKHGLYTQLKDIVAPGHTALVVWDVQNVRVGSIFNRDEFLQNLKSLIEAARNAGVPVIYTKITPLPIEYESPWIIYMRMKRSGIDDPDKLPQFMRPDSLEAEIHDEVKPMDNDIVINKHTASIFIGTHFESMMRNTGISTILFTGISTEWGVDSSARDSANRGFYTIVVQDCVSSPDEEMHESALKTLRRVTLVMPSGDIIQQWR